jgi:hypothetical protein
MSERAPNSDGSLAGLALGIGVGGHAIAWTLFWALGQADTEHAPMPAWGALVFAFAGREGIMAVFSLAAMLPLYAGAQEVAHGGRPRVARALSLAFAAVAGALAWRWWTDGRTVWAVLAGLSTIPGLLGPAPPRR